MRGQLRDITGLRFGRWTVVERASNRFGNTPYWLCRCACGRQKEVNGQCLQEGGSTSCGCSRIGNGNRRKHGLTRTRLYKIWSNMLERCNNPKRRVYPYYGGRGIEVCERWRIFENFLADMGHEPKGYTLDRINVDGNYEPGNCRWASRKEQARNTRRNNVITFNGKSLSLSEWEDELGISQSVLGQRLRAGWTPEDALTRPLRVVAKRRAA